MATEYKHTQIGYLILITFGAAILFLIYLTIVTNFNLFTWVILIILLICLGLFATLTVKVNDRIIEIQFGLGIIRKTFSLKDINVYRVVKNPWYYGWGIHFTSRGWLFNVSGFSAIELEMKNGRIYRIGTDDVEGLAKAIEEALSLQ
jgi:hypothetical protein